MEWVCLEKVIYYVTVGEMSGDVHNREKFGESGNKIERGSHPEIINIRITGLIYCVEYTPQKEKNP